MMIIEIAPYLINLFNLSFIEILHNDESDKEAITGGVLTFADAEIELNAEQTKELIHKMKMAFAAQQQPQPQFAVPLPNLRAQ